MRKHLRWIVLAVLALFFGFVVADSLGVFNDKPYDEVPHGNHTHFVAKDRDPSVPIGRFPTRPPGPDERITPRGEIVSK